MDAARRQIDTAIRMTFANEDPVAIHSVVAAGHRIIRDICELRGDVESYLRFTDWIEPKFEREFWRHMNASANFLKHAESDSNSVHELDDEAADYMIVFASKWYGDLGYTRSREMNTFATWWAIQRPEQITPSFLAQIEKAGFIEQFETMKRHIAVLNRIDRLRIGKLMLTGASEDMPKSSSANIRLKR